MIHRSYRVQHYPLHSQCLLVFHSRKGSFSNGRSIFITIELNFYSESKQYIHELSGTILVRLFVNTTVIVFSGDNRKQLVF